MQLIKHIKASNILSFGMDGLDLSLSNLNVLVGPNGSGKSNFIELFSLLRSLPRSVEESSTNLQGVIRRGGGMREWIWKGNRGDKAQLEVVLFNSDKSKVYRHAISLDGIGQKLNINNEIIDNQDSSNANLTEHVVHYKMDFLDIAIRRRRGNIITGEQDKELLTHAFSSSSSILSLRRDSLSYPVLSFIATAYEKIRLFREWNFGRNTIFREPQRADMRNDRLEEDFSNLGLYLNNLAKHPQIKRTLTLALRDLYEGLEGYEVIIEGGTVQVFFTEGNFSIPATRLSDGTLRYLCLLAILLDPTPPPLICIEEPELGMHPDILPKIADLLIAASKRTQLIVTTHSDILIDALSDQPESVLICEKHQDQTSIRRLDKNELQPWLEQYRLGQLWSMGEIGGNRW